MIMKRSEFLKSFGLIGLGLIVAPQLLVKSNPIKVTTAKVEILGSKDLIGMLKAGIPVKNKEFIITETHDIYQPGFVISNCKFNLKGRDAHIHLTGEHGKFTKNIVIGNYNSGYAILQK